MAVNQKVILEFLEKYNESKRTGVKLTKKDLSPIARLKKEYDKVLSQGSEPEKKNYETLIALQKQNQKFLDSQKKSFIDEQHYHEAKSIIARQQKRVLAESLKLHAKHKHLTPKEVEDIQKQIRELSKIEKVRRKEEHSERKGAATAELMLAATFGISKVYDGSGGKKMMGALKGMRRELRKAITATNLLTTIFSNGAQMFLSAQTAGMHAFREGGFKDGLKSIQGVAEEITRGAVVAPFDVIARVQNEIKNAIPAFDNLGAGSPEYNRMMARSAELSAMGVQTADIAKGISALTGPFQSGSEDILDAQDFIHGVALETKRSIKQSFRDMAAVMPQYVRYGREGGMEMFRRIANVAKRTNVDVKDLQELTDGLDNTEDALEQAAKFNALLGGNYLNGVQLLAADPDEKLKLIAEAYKRAESNVGAIHSNVRRSIFETMNITGDKFSNIVNGDFSKLETDMAKELKKPTKKQKEDALRESLDAQKVVQARLAGIGQKFALAMMQNELVMKSITYTMKNFKTILYGVGAVAAAITTANLIRAAVGTPLKPMLVSFFGTRGGGGGKGKGKGKGGGKGKGQGGRGSKVPTAPGTTAPQVRAPKGGITIGDKFYRGGSFLPKGTTLPAPAPVGFWAKASAKVSGAYRASADFATSQVSKAKNFAIATKDFTVRQAKNVKKFTVDAFAAAKNKVLQGASKIRNSAVGSFVSKYAGRIGKTLSKMSPGAALKRAKGTLSKFFSSVGGKTLGRIFGVLISPIITIASAHGQIKSAIAQGLKGNLLHDAVGRIFLDEALALTIGMSLGAFLGGIGSLGGPLAFAASVLGYIAGDYIGRTLSGLLQKSAPKLAPAIGEWMMTWSVLPYQDLYKKQHSSASTGNTTTIEGKPGAFSNSNTNDGVQTIRVDDTAHAMSPAPVKKRDFEKSKKDGLLLEEIYSIRDTIMEVSRVTNKVTLSVDGRAIGMASING